MFLINSFNRHWFTLLSPFADRELGPVPKLARALARLFPRSKVYKSWQAVALCKSKMPKNTEVLGTLSIEDVAAKDCCLCSGWIFHPYKDIKELWVLGAGTRHAIDVHGLHEGFSGEKFSFVKKAFRSRYIGILPRRFVPKSESTIMLEVKYQNGEREIVPFRIAPQLHEFLGVPVENI